MLNTRCGEDGGTITSDSRDGVGEVSVHNTGLYYEGNVYKCSFLLVHDLEYKHTQQHL